MNSIKTTRPMSAKQTLACKYLPETKRVSSALTANNTTRMYRFYSVYLRAIFTPVYFRIPADCPPSSRHPCS